MTGATLHFMTAMLGLGLHAPILASDYHHYDQVSKGG